MYSLRKNCQCSSAGTFFSNNVVSECTIQPIHEEIHNKNIGNQHVGNDTVGNDSIVGKEDAVGNKEVCHDDVTNNVVDGTINNETNKEHDADKDSPIDIIEINNESELQTAEEFEGLRFKDKPTEGAGGLGALDFTEKLDDVILWGDDDSVHNQKIGDDGDDDHKLTSIESEKEKKDKKSADRSHSDEFAVVQDVVEEMVMQIDLMNQIAEVLLSL